MSVFNRPTPDRMGRLPIHYAANDRGMDVELRKLIAKGQDVNARDDAGWTPLHFAANKTKIETIRILLAAGAEVDAVNDEGETPLMLSVAHGDIEAAPAVIAVLREHGADPYREAADGCTPVRFARMIDQVAIGEAFADLP